jgi:hypothetical protein
VELNQTHGQARERRDAAIVSRLRDGSAAGRRRHGDGRRRNAATGLVDHDDAELGLLRGALRPRGRCSDEQRREDDDESFHFFCSNVLALNVWFNL